MTGRLVVLEGGEGCGKSTQAVRLAQRLGALLTREPGGTPMGERIRSLVLDPAAAGLVARAEALLMAAARAQHVAEVVAPALAAGRHVVSDRFTGSSLAYQGYGRGLPVDELRLLSSFATGGLEADLVVLLELDAAVVARRRDRQPDRVEAAGPEFHRRVGEGFAALASADAERWVRVDGEGSEDEVADRVWAALTARLGDPAGW